MVSKYRNVKTVIDGFAFDSKGEATRYSELLMFQRAGKIHNLELQVPFVILDGFKTNQGEVVRPIKYVADFCYTEEGREIAEDFKGMKTAVYKLKKKMFQSRYRNIELREVTA